MKPLFQSSFCPNDCDKKPQSAETDTVVWKEGRYRYKVLSAGFKIEDIPSWGKYGWCQSRSHDRIDIKQMDKHEGILTRTSIGSEIGWSFNHKYLNDKFHPYYPYIVFSEKLV